jgi:phosphatidylinositol alpha-mannosyltransferase
VPAIVTDGVHGLLVPDDDDAAVAAAVTRLLEDPPFARQLASAGHASCAAYAWPVVREGWIEAYQTAAAVDIRARGADPSGPQGEPEELAPQA